MFLLLQGYLGVCGLKFNGIELASRFPGLSRVKGVRV